jgi:hypothetical protein
VPATDRIIVEVKKRGDLRAGLSPIQKQNCICAPRNPVILAMATHTALKLKTVVGGKEIWTDHAQYRIYPR